MLPSLGADSVGLMMLRLQIEMRLRAASDAVLAFLRSHPIAELRGGGLFASADMMSLEATRYLWAARLYPRRRTYAVGTYTHVLDQRGILRSADRPQPAPGGRRDRNKSQQRARIARAG